MISMLLKLALILTLHTDKGSSADETRPDSAGGEDETIMEPEQGSGECNFGFLDREGPTWWVMVGLMLYGAA